MNDIEAMLNKGKYLYNISFTARVRYNDSGNVNFATEEKSVQFRSNLSFNKVNNWNTAKRVCRLYYFWKDYSALDELLDFKITHVDVTVNIKDVDLWAICLNRQYRNWFFN